MRFYTLCRFIASALSLFLLWSCSQQQPPKAESDIDKPATTVLTNNAENQFKELIEHHWQKNMDYYPEFASYLGMGNDQRNSRWQDISLESYAAHLQDTKNTLTSLTAIDRSKLSDADKVNYDLFLWQQQMDVNESQFQTHLIPITQRDGIQALDDFANYVPLKSVQDYDNWLARLQKLPALIAQTQTLMEKGIASGVMPSADTMARVPAQLKKQIVDTPTDSLFYKPFADIDSKISASDQQRLQQQAIEIIGQQLVPAYKEFTQFFENQYLPACRDTHGVWDLPKGKEFYRYLVKYFTTTDLTPEEIHQIGLQEVARNRAEMDEVIAEVGFKGSFDEFVQFLRTDPQFYYDTPEALMEGYLAVSKRLDPELVHLFGKLPRVPYGLKAIPDSIAPDTTTAYYSSPSADGTRAGYYFVNLYQPHTRPKYEMEVLSVHEAVPGHHLQIALQMELGELPMFRRFQDFTVFTEGWGLYSERLGYDMGLYKDPYSRFGQLTYDMWRSVRLVVDTGIHYMGWTRQQAIDYFKANAAKTEEDIINEIDRYISMPGQALAYKIGQLKILELRQQAETELADKFDIRAFHDVVLGAGSVPLYVLQANVEQWIKQQQLVQ
ncbi:DUF885 domain-containing protein [Alteromonadaceae bacterium BrNp21-10]|nr:DUF885 domain-containing protein [Alteromonadaceae bacterium BrNp21-10]